MTRLCNTICEPFTELLFSDAMTCCHLAVIVDTNEPSCNRFIIMLSANRCKENITGDKSYEMSGGNSCDYCIYFFVS